MFLKRLGETVATFDAGADVANDVTHYFVSGLIGQRLERLHHRQPGIDHGRQLAGKHHQVSQAHSSTAGPAFLADLLLDRDDQHVAVQERGNGGLLGRGFDRTANFAARGRFPSDIDERAHSFENRLIN